MTKAKKTKKEIRDQIIAEMTALDFPAQDVALYRLTDERVDYNWSVANLRMTPQSDAAMRALQTIEKRLQALYDLADDD